MSDSGSMSVGTPEMGKFYSKRGTMQTPEDMRLGMQSPLGMNENPISTNYENMGTTTSVTGPNIPPRSPNRALSRGNDNYF